MRYVNIEEYRKKNFSPESCPTIRSIRNWIKQGKLKAVKKGRSLYIDTYAESTGNPWVDRVLRDK